MGQERSKPPRSKPPRVVWRSTAIQGSVKGHSEYSVLTHAACIENALLIVKRGSIKPQPERAHGKTLLDKPIEVAWLSPNNDWPNVYGCVAFHFDWTALVKYYGEYIYGLEEVQGWTRKRDPLWTARILFSDSDYSSYFGGCYDPAADGIPWKTCDGCHYIKAGCVLQVGVTTPVSLCEMKSIAFVNQRNRGSGGIKIDQDDAARLFLARAVSEKLPFINGFSGVNRATKQPNEQLLFAWRKLWLDIWNDYDEYQGTITSTDGNGETLARAFLDRYGRIQPRSNLQALAFGDDAKNIASLFRSAKSLLLSIRKVVAAWADIKNLSSLDSEGWPPWSEGSRYRKRQRK